MRVSIPIYGCNFVSDLEHKPFNIGTMKKRISEANRQTRQMLISEINTMLKSGLSTSEAIDICVPTVCAYNRIDYTITHGEESDNFGAKVRLFDGVQNYTLVF